MHQIDNRTILKLFSETDEIKYFYDCHDITMANADGYKIKHVEYFTESKDDILSSFACIKTYYDDSITVALNSSNLNFSKEILEYLYSHIATEIDIASPYIELTDIPYFNEKFETLSCETGAPVYAIYSQDKLTALQMREGITVTLATDKDKTEVSTDPAVLSEIEEDLRENFFGTADCFTDTKFYLLKSDSKIIGFLRAECGYKNYYDVGWVYVAPKYRNNGYGKLLALYFSYDCFKNGLHPHYGYAISSESEKTAISCGYVCTRTSRNWIKLTRK